MIRVAYVQYTNPAAYPPLEHSSRILVGEGWQILFLGIGALGADALRFPPHERIEVRQMRFSPAGCWQKLHCLLASTYVCREMVKLFLVHRCHCCVGLMGRPLN